MVEFLDVRISREEPTQDYIRNTEPELSKIPDWSVVRFDSRQWGCDGNYMKYNLSRRAGKAEAIVCANYNAPLIRRVMGTVGINNPGVSIIMGFKNGRCAAYLCVDRLPDNGRADFGTGDGMQDGESFIETMNVLSTLGNVPCFVVFSLDSWAPGKDFDDYITWYEAPWTIARALGRLDSRKTKELQELVIFRQESEVPNSEDLEDDYADIEDYCSTDASDGD